MSGRMRNLLVRLGGWSAVTLLSASLAVGGTLQGVVKNGTTGKPAASVEVALIELQGGMQPVSSTKSGADGQFSFDNPALGAQPMLVRAVYHGINFNQPVPPGTSQVEVSVFEQTQDPKSIAASSRVVIFQPNGANLLVGEEYSVQNKTQPPQAYFRAAGNFDFVLPQGAQLQQVAAWGPSGMPVAQAQIDKGKNRYAIAYAFRPGDSGVRYSYEVPYPGNAAVVKIPVTYAGRLVVVAPPSVQISGEGLQPAGQEQGMSVYERQNNAAGTTLAVNISGTAPPPSSPGGGDAGNAGQGQGGEPAGAAETGAAIQQVPGKLDSLKWPLVVGFLALFLLGAIFLARKPVGVVAAAPAVAARPDPARGPRASRASATDPAPPAIPKGAQPQATLPDLDAAAGASLDQLKERIFRLELRRQAGTISEEDYTEERTRVEKILRDLVRG